MSYYLNIIYECIHKVNSLGEDFTITNNDLKILNPFVENSVTGENRSANGYCKLLDQAVNNEPRFEIAFNADLLFDSLKPLFKSTIYHELAHYLQFKKAFKDGVLVYVNNNWVINPNQADYYIGPREVGGHSTLWSQFASKINSSCGLEIPVTPTTDFLRIELPLLIQQRDNASFVLTCNRCNFFQPYISEREYLDKNLLGSHVLAQILLTNSSNKENTLCPSCGGNLKINFKDKAHEDEVLRNVYLDINRDFGGDE